MSLCAWSPWRCLSTDTFVFRLHYKVTMGLMLACCLLITAIQLVTDPITCDVKVSF